MIFFSILQTIFPFQARSFLSIIHCMNDSLSFHSFTNLCFPDKHIQYIIAQLSVPSRSVRFVCGCGVGVVCV